MKIRTLFIILLLILLNSFSHAIAGKDIYKYVDKDGNIVMSFDTKGMYRGYIKSDGETAIEIYK